MAKMYQKVLGSLDLNKNMMSLKSVAPISFQVMVFLSNNYVLFKTVNSEAFVSHFFTATSWYPQRYTNTICATAIFHIPLLALKFCFSGVYTLMNTINVKENRIWPQNSKLVLWKTHLIKQLPPIIFHSVAQCQQGTGIEATQRK